jgi:Domain of unknown function (DUF4410)
MFRTVSSLGTAMALALAALSLSACGGSHRAPTLPSGQPLAVMVTLDRTAPPDTPPDRLQQLQQVSDQFEADLVDVLRANGYDAAAVAAVDTPTGPGRYSLRVQILNYNAGSKAARMFVGFGAGSARLDAGFELFGTGGASYVKGTPGVSTSRADWRHVVRKVNEDIVAAVNVRLGQGL